jgi:phytoene dehydrogenase-like protein
MTGFKRSFKYSSVLHNSPTVSEAFISNPDKLKSKYDVVIIGAGHNGLIAANYLAKMSKNKLKICVLERRHVIGGAAVTEEIVPGFKFSRASYLLSLFRPIIIEELGLMRHGTLKFHTRDPSGYTPVLETDPQYSSLCRSLTLGPHANKNYEQIAKFSKKDAHKFEQYENRLNELCSVLERFLDNPPPNLSILKEKGKYLQKLMLLRNYLSDIYAVNFFAKHHDEIYRLFTAPAAHILDEWFESDVLKATIATDSVIGAMLSPYSEGSAYVLLHHIIGGIDGQKGVWVRKKR